ncbi:hypothetical protein MUK72_16060 (plasmid) [Halococcus dombrowskii]|uniref:Uncharacterized protein n=1 Tax=Halococcus dombrowskii TaxID=179637 RepID=A0AAV3SEZ0_HALDO|nr:hypothetical protein [Halococcus dombrowskii]UOO96694.1 hypothetical protein MUK72_16060 [Halococcus dombrowskii]
MSSSDYGDPEYLCYEILQQMDQQSDKDIYETEFNKLCYMAYYTLRDEGVDTELPVYWYQWGGVPRINANEYPIFYESSEGSTLVYVEELPESAFDVARSVREKVIQVARSLANRYKNVYGVKTIVDDSYEEFAPNEFIKSFNSFRSTVEGLESEQSTLSDAFSSSEGKMEALRPQMNMLVKSYPSDRYEMMETEFRQWDSITRQLAKNNQIEELEEFALRFWEAISRVELRLTHNDNIPSETITSWFAGRESEHDAFAAEIPEYRSIALESRQTTSKLDNIADSYSNTVRRMAQDSHNDE